MHTHTCTHAQKYKQIIKHMWKFPSLLIVKVNKLLLVSMEGLPGGTGGKESSYLRDTGSISGQEDPLEEGMATHSSILAWRIPWTEEPGGLLGSQRVGHD